MSLGYMILMYKILGRLLPLAVYMFSLIINTMTHTQQTVSSSTEHSG